MDTILYRQKYIKNKMQHASSTGFSYDSLLWLFSIDGSFMEVYSKDFLEDKFVAIYPYFNECNIPRTERDIENCLKHFPYQKASTTSMIETYLDDKLKNIMLTKIKDNILLSTIDIKLFYKCFKKEIERKYKKIMRTNALLNECKTSRRMNNEQKRIKMLKVRQMLEDEDECGCHRMV